MDSSPNPKGVRVKGITMKARGSLPPPPEVIRTDLTAIVPQMFSRREAKKGESLKVKVGIPAKAVEKPVVVEPVVVEPVLSAKAVVEPKKKVRLQMPVESPESAEEAPESTEESSNSNESPEPNIYEGVPPNL